MHGTDYIPLVLRINREDWHLLPHGSFIGNWPRAAEFAKAERKRFPRNLVRVRRFGGNICYYSTRPEEAYAAIRAAL